MTSRIASSASHGTGAVSAADARLSPLMAQAAAFGALWGAVEVTTGSFLHALHIPFTGVLLASIGAGLLVAQRQICGRRGISIMTGVVAALCKSLSPAGIIWNPMAAIVMEAAIAEAFLTLAPRAAASAIAVGALAVAWSIGQGLFTQYILYGSNVFSLYVTVVGKTASWLGVETASAWLTLAGVAAAFIIFGGLVGLWGRRVGTLARERLSRGVE